MKIGSKDEVVVGSTSLESRPGPSTYFITDDVDGFYLQIGKDEMIAADP